MRLKLLGLALVALAAPALAAETWQEPNTGMEFVGLDKGCFKMGIPANSFATADGGMSSRLKTEMPQHEVCLDAFWIGRHEVREADWEKVMGSKRSSGPADAPVAGVTWEEANDFARRLTELSSGQARFRLPTEAEWEFACRGGAKPITEVPSRPDLNGKAWYSSSYDMDNAGLRIREVQPVGKKSPNGYGLYDMLGNVWEWVQDAYRPDAYAKHALYNPSVQGTGEKRVIRGGGLRTDPRLTRCETRAWMPAGEGHATLGLRLVRDR